MSSASLQQLFSGSIPYKVDRRSGDPLCHWLYLEKQRFTEPFFDETISACRHHPFNSKRQRCVSTLEMLAEWSGEIRSVPPTAIIFHVSRCGSTLASQLLALPEENIRRGFESLTVSFGCTGGQHRSVYAADALARHLRNKFKVKVELKHVEQEAKNWVNQ